MAGLYVHVPFCTQRCSYCDFYTQTDSRLRTDYLRALRRELAERAAELDHEPLDTIYFGGGTPSQLPIEALRAIFRTIRAHYDVSSCREITLEANPESTEPMSPVRNQPSGVKASASASGLLW